LAKEDGIIITFKGIMKTLVKCVVGSKLHGLDTPESDTDYRGIFLYPLKEVVNPFQTLKNTHWIE
jgi:predicted nucleotidyltransferase